LCIIESAVAMKEFTLIFLICFALTFLTYVILKVGSMTGYLGWLAIPATCLIYFVAELAVKHWGIFKGKK